MTSLAAGTSALLKLLKYIVLFSERKCSVKTDPYRQFPLVPAPDPEPAGERGHGAGDLGEHQHDDQRDPVTGEHLERGEWVMTNMMSLRSPSRM